MFHPCSSLLPSVVEEARPWVQAEVSPPVPGRAAMAEPGDRNEGAEDPGVLGDPGQTRVSQISFSQRAGHFQEPSAEGEGQCLLD